MSVFQSNLDYYLDDARKSVTDDPTLQPWIDALQRESLEGYQRSTYDLHDQMARGSLLGTGYYGGMLGFANEEYNEALQNTLAGVYKDRFNAVEQNELAALGMLNNRDMNAASNKAQVASARIGAAPGMASVALQRQQWNAQRPYTDLQNTINIMNGLNGLGGYTMAPNYVPQAPGYYGPSGSQAAIMGGFAGALQGAGMAGQFGYLKGA